jgi:26S proteasome regulatory subunit (ATPase 3-interacting protein)
VDAILENYPKPKKVLFEEIGLETEEELGIKIPDV